jgi:hypothetical protein
MISSFSNIPSVSIIDAVNNPSPMTWLMNIITGLIVGLIVGLFLLIIDNRTRNREQDRIKREEEEKKCIDIRDTFCELAMNAKMKISVSDGKTYEISMYDLLIRKWKLHFMDDYKFQFNKLFTYLDIKIDNRNIHINPINDVNMNRFKHFVKTNKYLGDPMEFLYNNKVITYSIAQNIIYLTNGLGPLQLFHRRVNSLISKLAEKFDDIGIELIRDDTYDNKDKLQINIENSNKPTHDIHKNIFNETAQMYIC